MYTLGLVLAGGAARGAYEAGVMRFLYQTLPKRLGRVPWPDVVSGTSVGALNGVFSVTRDLDVFQRLTEIWQQMQISDVYELHSRSMLRTVRGMFTGDDHAALLDVAPLYDLARREFPEETMRKSLDSQECSAFIISATQLDNGVNVLFLDSGVQGLDLQPLPNARERRTHLTADHLLASAAIPFLFPPVLIDSVYYVDGGLRQNTPLRPVLRAGADRIITISPHIPIAPELPDGTAPTPSVPFLAGKTLNALMLDPVERDLYMAEQINEILKWGREHYGAGFSAGVLRDLGLREVRNFHIQPSEDLGRIANQMLHSSPPRVSAPIRWMLSLVADQANQEDGESDLLSYLYFDRAFTAEIEQLGHEDAARLEDELLAFLT
ncbi:MAG: patatin-like phospholipase family protein [Myxococcota bacterium]